MKTLLITLILLTLSGVLAGCYRPQSGAGLHLPDGDLEKGKAAFVALKCHQCHRVEGVDLPAPVPTAPTNIVLGGEVIRVQTYGELVTSVINPSHSLAPGFDQEQIKDGKLSPMPDYTDSMTVRQMIDLVAFLQSRYKELEPNYKYR